jgi:hypothetical protein
MPAHFKPAEEWAAHDLTAVLHQVGARTPLWLSLATARRAGRRSVVAQIEPR